MRSLNCNTLELVIDRPVELGANIAYRANLFHVCFSYSHGLAASSPQCRTASSLRNMRNYAEIPNLWISA